MKQPWLAFDKTWFARHQKLLLWLLACPTTRRWARWILCIRRRDIGYAKTIVAILPHCYAVQGDDPETYIAEFRTHPKYAKRIYFAFRTLWWAMHYWDAWFADRWVPQLSFGFLTLTTSPDEGTGATTVDGWAGRSAAEDTFANLRAGAGTEFTTTNNFIFSQLVAGTTTNLFSELRRGIFTFDTSPIGSGPLISAVLSVIFPGSSITLGSPDLHVAGATPAVDNDLQNSDYGQCQTTSFASLAMADAVLPPFLDYNDISLNASGLANIHPTGISRFSTQLGWDLNAAFTGTWVNSGASYYAIYGADVLGTSQDPKLAVTYGATYTKFLGASLPLFNMRTVG
jgi:hypothetical protein